MSLLPAAAIDAAAKRQFAQQRFLRLERLVSADTMGLYSDYARNYVRAADYFQFEPDTCSLGRYADALGEVLLVRLLPVVEALASKRVFPTYSFLRFYTPESRLSKHTDRPSCEYSLSLTVGHDDAQTAWPILLESVDGQVRSIDLAVGDGLLFQGTELPHWREPLEQGHWLQLFLHYVDADGPQAGHRFDGRRSAGPCTRRAA